MAERGAKSIIVPSRSGASSQAAIDVVSQLKAKGITIVVTQCDVSSATEVERLLREFADMPPIKGCMNLAMVLQVSHCTITLPLMLTHYSGRSL